MIKIALDTNNSAFEDNPNELHQILQTVASEISVGYVDMWTIPFSGDIKDSSGNMIGSFEVDT